MTARSDRTPQDPVSAPRTPAGRNRPATRHRTGRITRAALTVLALAAVPAAFAGPPGLRLAVVGLLVLVGPGGAAACWAAGAGDPPDTAPVGFYPAVAVATSLAAATLVATALVYAHWWHPAAGVCTLAGLTLALLAAPHVTRHARRTP